MDNRQNESSSTLFSNADYMKLYMRESQETPEQIQQRLKADRVRKKQKREQESEQQRAARLEPLNRNQEKDFVRRVKKKESPDWRF